MSVFPRSAIQSGVTVSLMMGRSTDQYLIKPHDESINCDQRNSQYRHHYDGQKEEAAGFLRPTQISVFGHGMREKEARRNTLFNVDAESIV
jgi:hypothetical protein